MKSYPHFLLPVLRGRDALDRRLAGLLPWHTTSILIDVFRSDLTGELNVLRLRDAASDAPKHVQRVLPCGPLHAMLLLAAVPATTRRAIEYADRIAGQENYVVFADGVARDRHGRTVVGSRLDADSLDQWAAHLGLDLRADGLFERTPGFIAYARAVSLP